MYNDVNFTQDNPDNYNNDQGANVYELAKDYVDMSEVQFEDNDIYQKS